MIQFTSSQLQAIEAFRSFLSGTEQVFMLKGAAGTGKTTILSEFIRILSDAKREVSLMAPTGRAAYILGNKTGKPATTIHRGIYALNKLTPVSHGNDNEDEGTVHAKFGLKDNDSSLNMVYIVDESSMISDSFSETETFSFGSGCLLADLFSYAGGRKIIFVGDYAQLPPVGMNFSPALDKDYVENSFLCGVVEFYLREVMRQKEGSVMLDNAKKVRDWIESKSFIEFGLSNGDDCEAEYYDLLQPYFRLSEDRPHVHSVIIAYSNRQALQYNLSIRNHYFGENGPRLKSGDLLMITRNNYAYEHELFNGNIVKVESCSPDSEVEIHTVRVRIGQGRTESMDLRFRKVVLKFKAGNEVVTMNARILDNFLDDSNGAVGGLVARALMIDFEKRLPSQIKNELPMIKRTLRGSSKLSLAQQEIYDSYLKLLWNDPYYNAVICKYGYAMTCHKAQGGEWKNVFVDMGRFGGTANEDYFRWAYTAITRASSKIWHFRAPEFNFISGLVVEPIQHSSNIRVSTYAAGEDFRHARFEIIQTLAKKAGLEASENFPAPYQHHISFKDKENHTCAFNLWFKECGYSNRDVFLRTDSDDLAALAKSIVDASYIPESVPYKNADRPFAEKLVDFMKSQFKECDIQLLNITQEQYQDVFHLKTDGYAKVCMYYTDKGNYTYMRLISSLGEHDEKLQSFRKNFI